MSEEMVARYAANSRHRIVSWHSKRRTFDQDHQADEAGFVNCEQTLASHGRLPPEPGAMQRYGSGAAAQLEPRDARHVFGVQPAKVQPFNPRLG